jgi:hypothetical protein
MGGEGGSLTQSQRYAELQQRNGLEAQEKRSTWHGSKRTGAGEYARVVGLDLSDGKRRTLELDGGVRLGTADGGPSADGARAGGTGDGPQTAAASRR